MSEITQKDLFALMNQLERIADALEKQNKINEKKFIFEKKKFKALNGSLTLNENEKIPAEEKT